MHTSPAIPDYQQAQRESVYYVYPSGDAFQISGPDRIDFLQRQSTNDIRSLQPGSAVTTVLTSSTARILDVLTLIEQGEESLLALSLPGRAAATAAFLSGKIFFMDKVEVSEQSEAYFRVDVEGPAAAKTLAQLGIAALPAVDATILAEIGGAAVTVIGGRGLTAETSYHLVGQRTGQETVLQALLKANCPALSAATREILRVEAGRPGPTAELTEDYTPLEVKLDWSISHTKGCYTGQEVIARQVNYDKITKQLVRLRLSAPAQPGDKLRAEGTNAGTITSVAASPSYGLLALAVVKRPYFENGTQLSIANEQNPANAVVETIN